jgi:regulator-associated protein of mTOR
VGGVISPATQPVEDCMQLAACRADESLPTSPLYPADLFTSCITTPIEMALRWVFTTKQQHLLPGVTLEMLDELPGQVADRSTMRGQLNWIFTAVTDSIAWNILPANTFQRIFRNDLLAAALFRNFLLAERIMRDVNCTPVSDPELPPAYNHPLWAAWDLAVDFCLAQLPGILAGEEVFQDCPFFSHQLTAFEVWLNMAGPEQEASSGPEQLPVVLQVLLSQHHRLRALQLLDRFLGLGPWAVERALSVGIFPYVFKLLGSASSELQGVLISIWAKLLAVDKSCRLDLLKPPAAVVRRGGARVTDKAFAYFLRALGDDSLGDELHTQAAFVLASFLEENPQGMAWPGCQRASVIRRGIAVREGAYLAMPAHAHPPPHPPCLPTNRPEGLL